MMNLVFQFYSELYFLDSKTEHAAVNAAALTNVNHETQSHLMVGKSGDDSSPSIFKSIACGVSSGCYLLTVACQNSCH